MKRSMAIPVISLRESEWIDNASDAPTQNDFYAHEKDLDGKAAWEQLGGLTRSQAYERLKTNPLYYQEAFMWMGGRAFSYYLPVIERFLFDPSAADDADDRQVWIFARCIKLQFESADRHELVRGLADRALALARSVRGNLALFGSTWEDQSRVDEAWSELERLLNSLAFSGRPDGS